MSSPGKEATVKKENGEKKVEGKEKDKIEKKEKTEKKEEKKKDEPKKETKKEDKKETPKKETPKKETPKKETPKKETKEEPKKDTKKEEPKKDAKKEEPKKDNKKEDTKKDTKKEDTKKDTKKEDTKKDTKKEEPKKDTKKEEAKKDTKKEEPKKDTKKEEPKKDTKKEEPKKDKKEDPKKDTKKDTKTESKKEDKKDDGKKKEDNKKKEESGKKDDSSKKKDEGKKEETKKKDENVKKEDASKTKEESSKKADSKKKEEPAKKDDASKKKEENAKKDSVKKEKDVSVKKEDTKKEDAKKETKKEDSKKDAKKDAKEDSKKDVKKESKKGDAKEDKVKTEDKAAKEESDTESEDEKPLASFSKLEKGIARPIKQESKKRKASKPPKSKKSDDAEKEEESDDEASASDSDEDEPLAKKKRTSSTKSSSKGSKAGSKRKAAEMDKEPSSKDINDMSKYECREPQPFKEQKEANKWWNRPLAKGVKWNTLEHNGVIFPPPYQPHNVKMLYNGKEVDLTPEQEEVASFYAQMLETDHVKNPVFNKNFFNDWKKLLGQNHVIKEFKLCDFRPIYKYWVEDREKKKEEKKQKEVKKKLKEEKEALLELYGFCLVDGFKEKVGNFRVEPPGLFRGRGKHPKTGMVKGRIRPEDITINIGKGVPIPKPPPGHKWRGIVHDPTVTWLAMWKDTVNHDFKYVYLASSSRFKGESDMKKYHTAAKLKEKITAIRANYKAGWASPDRLERQRSVCMYLIDRLALRVGNEKDTSEKADTVGCCSLRVEHIKFHDDDQIELDFLGKDSMRYNNTVKVEPKVYKLLQDFVAKKKPSEDIFDLIKPPVLNEHFKSIMPGLTAKVFRTYNASETLERELSGEKDDIDEDKPEAEKLVFYNKANRTVAILCNHQKSVAKGFQGQMDRLKEMLAKQEELKEELEEHLEVLEGGKKKKKAKKSKKKEDGDKEEKERKLPSNAEACQKALERVEAKIKTYKAKMTIKDDTKTVALGTSKINYMDPRITIAWCKRKEVPIEKVFNKALMEKFPWAMEVPPNWEFKKENTFPSGAE